MTILIFPISNQSYVIHAHCPSYVVSINIYPMSSSDLSKSVALVPPHWELVLLSSHLLSFSLLMASVLPKLTHNRVVGFQYQSIGKGVIRLCP